MIPQPQRLTLTFAAALFGWQADLLAYQLFTPSPYLQCADSPLDQSGVFYLEDFEDGFLNVPGVVASVGSVAGPGIITDSVDHDDGAIDGDGGDGSSFFAVPGSVGITFTFDSTALGELPTQAGLVWTDGATINDVTFTAWDSNNVAHTTTLTGIGDDDFASGTSEDVFFGFESSLGISAIRIQCVRVEGAAGNGIEIDHLQFAFPGPSVWTDLGLGLAGTSGVPVLAASGSLRGGCPFNLSLTSARPNATSFLIVGLSPLNAPFKGGTMVPSFDALVGPIPTGPLGEWSANANWARGLPQGTPIYFQTWIADGAAVQGLAATNGVEGITP